MNFKDQLKKAYDIDAERRGTSGYEDTRDQWKIDLREQFAKLAKNEKKNSLLELGAGVGIDSEYFQKMGFEVLATDLSKGMVKACKKRGLKAKVLDLYELKSLGKKFDCIYSLNVLLHVPKKDLGKVLKIIHNTLNKDGLFFYGVYGGEDIEKVIRDKKKAKGLPRLFSYLSDKTLLKSIDALFEVINFKTIDIGSDRSNFYFQALTLRKK